MITNRFIFRAHPGTVRELIDCLTKLQSLAQQPGRSRAMRLYTRRRHPHPANHVELEWDGSDTFDGLSAALAGDNGALQAYQRILEDLEELFESVSLEVWEREGA